MLILLLDPCFHCSTRSSFIFRSCQKQIDTETWLTHFILLNCFLLTDSIVIPNMNEFQIENSLALLYVEWCQSIIHLRCVKLISKITFYISRDQSIERKVEQWTSTNIDQNVCEIHYQHQNDSSRWSNEIRFGFCSAIVVRNSIPFLISKDLLFFFNNEKMSNRMNQNRFERYSRLWRDRHQTGGIELSLFKWKF